MEQIKDKNVFYVARMYTTESAILFVDIYGRNSDAVDSINHESLESGNMTYVQITTEWNSIHELIHDIEVSNEGYSIIIQNHIQKEG